MGSYFFRQELRLWAATTKIATLAFASLVVASSLWLAIEHKLPRIAQAETVNTDLALDRRPNEPYEALRNRAVTAARTAAAESLVTDRQATEVTVTVIVRDRGQIVPILSLRAKRSEGLNPASRQGIKYFDQARSLLRFDNGIATNEPTNRSQRSVPNTTTPSSRVPRSIPSSTRTGTNGTFSQPGRIVNPQVGQPVNTSPSAQPTTTYTNTPSSQTSTPTTGVVPQSSSSPTASPSTPNNQTTNPTASPGTSLTPAAPIAPSGFSPSQPITPSPASSSGTGSTNQNPSTNPNASPSTNSNPSGVTNSSGTQP